MSESPTVLVVGAGPAGLAAAFALVRQGVLPTVLEAAPYASAPASPSGLLSPADLDPTGKEGTFPGGLDRIIVERRFALLDRETSFSVDLHAEAWAGPPPRTASFDAERLRTWGLERLRAAGATVVPGTRVDALALDESGRAIGVKVGGEVRRASITVVARGSEGPLLRTGPPASVRVGVQEFHRLSAAQADRRFGRGPDRGFALEAFLGFLPDGASAQGYLYGHREGVTVGLVARPAALARAHISPEEVLERFKAQPLVAAYLEGGSRRSHRARPLPEGPGRRTSLYGEGFLTVGEAAGITSVGPLSAGSLSLATRSGRLAGEVAARAVRAGDPSSRVLGDYVVRLEEAGIFADLARTRRALRVLEDNPRWAAVYARAVARAFREMMTERGQPKEHVQGLVRRSLRESGLSPPALLHDGLEVLLTL